MKIMIEIEVTNCLDCPFKKEHRGQGECWSYCSHPETKQKTYENILWGCQARFIEVPKWCPIFKKALVNERMLK